MPSDLYKKGKCLRVRSVDVGRKGHHYIRVCVTKSKGKRGGTTRMLGGLRKYKTDKPRIARVYNENTGKWTFLVEDKAR